MTPEPLMTKCCYRERGIHCESGLLYETVSGNAVLLEGTSVYCPACEGKGMLISRSGRDLLAFLKKFGRSDLRDIVDEALEERERG